MLKKKYRYLISYNFKDKIYNGFGEIDITFKHKISPIMLLEVKEDIKRLLLKENDKIKNPSIVILSIYKF